MWMVDRPREETTPEPQQLSAGRPFVPHPQAQSQSGAQALAQSFEQTVPSAVTPIHGRNSVIHPRGDFAETESIKPSLLQEGQGSLEQVAGEIRIWSAGHVKTLR